MNSNLKSKNNQESKNNQSKNNQIENIENNQELQIINTESNTDINKVKFENVCPNQNIVNNVNIKDISKTYLKTPYYKTIIYPDHNGPIFPSQYNYSNYDKFCLKTNLDPIFSALDFIIEFVSVEINNKMILTVQPRKNGNLVQMSENLQFRLQEEVDFVCENLYHMCLLFDPGDDTTEFPKQWILNITPELTIDNSYTPSFINGKIYLSLDETSDYSTIYSEVFDSLMNQITDLYIDGTVSCDEDFAKKWNLINLHNSLYICGWNDGRITNDRAMFLLKLLNKGIIILDIGKSNYIKHLISELYMNNGKYIMFDVIMNDIIEIIPENIGEIYEIMNVINKNEDLGNLENNEKSYTIITIPIENLNMFEKYKNVAENIWKDANCVWYKVNDAYKPYMFSCMIGTMENNMLEKINKYL